MFLLLQYKNYYKYLDLSAFLLLKRAATSKAVKNYQFFLLHINILEPFTNHGKVKKK